MLQNKIRDFYSVLSNKMIDEACHSRRFALLCYCVSSLAHKVNACVRIYKKVRITRGSGRCFPAGLFERILQQSQRLFFDSLAVLGTLLIFAIAKHKVWNMGKSAVIEALHHYFSTQPVLKVWLFGSFSRGEEAQNSDSNTIFDGIPCPSL